MQLQLPIFGLLCYMAVCLHAQDTLFETDALPMHNNNTIDQRLLPSVGNGHLGYVVKTDTLHVNGLYNGRGAESHRARVPTRNSIEIELSSDNVQLTETRNYQLDVAKGIWKEEIVVDQVCQVDMYVYAHQTYNRILVTQVHFKRLTDNSGRINQDPITITYTKIPTERMESEDLADEQTVEFDKYSWKRTATTRVAESESTMKSNVYMYYNDIPDKIAINQGDTNDNWYSYILSVDTVDSTAQKDFVDAETILRSGSVDAHTTFLNNHTKKWEQVWNHGRIETSNSEYNRLAFSSLYYLLSSLPTLGETNTAKSQYYGLSPDGLANGGQGRDFYGHVLPDMEINMFPPILMFHPTVAKEMLSYRYHLRSAATSLAEEGGYKYPYESGSSGTELTGIELYEHRAYVSGDVAFAARQYLSATRDLTWLSDSGRTLMNNVANFLQSKANFDRALGAYGIDDVSGPDDYPGVVVDNSVYTNIGASNAIVYADYANCLLSQNAVSDEWLEKANDMAVLYDHKEMYHPEYEGYKKETVVNAADVILVGYPHDFEMPSDVRENDLDVYEEFTNFQVAPPTAKAMFAIGYLEVGNIDKAKNHFTQSYDYTRGDFNVWTNSTYGTDAVNYINGMGTFLQSLVFGYGGLRLRHEQIDFDPILPPSTDHMNLIGLEFLGSEFDFKFDSNMIYVNVTSLDDSHPLQITTSDGRTFSLDEGEELSFSLQNGTISTTATTGCSLKPITGGLVSAASQVVLYPITFLWVTLVALFCSNA